MGGLAMIGAVAFDPTIRGILVILTGSTVLMGSIFLVLSTNSGVRVGFLIAASALFGWFVLMSTLWTIYESGLKGRDPAWMATDINYNRSTPVPEVPVLDKLPRDTQLANAADVFERHPLIHAMVLGSENANYTPATLTKLKTVVQPYVVISNQNLGPIVEKAKVQGKAVIDQNPDVAALINKGGDELRDAVRADAAKLRAEIDSPDHGWCLLTESDPRRGEAQASADAALIAAKAFGDPTTSANYIVKDVFFFGGKDTCAPLSEQSSIDQAKHRISTIFRVKQPKLWAAVTVKKTIDFPPVDGQAPPPATADPKASTVTVLMLRNFGNKRFIPFMFMVFSLLGFIVFTSILHYRDKNAMAVRAAFSAPGKGKN